MRTETSYVGLRLAHPFIAASPLGYRVDTIERLEDAGAVSDDLVASGIRS